MRNRFLIAAFVFTDIVCQTGGARAAVTAVYVPIGSPANATFVGGQVAGSRFQAVNTVTFHSLGFIDLNDSFPTLGGPDGIHDSYQIGIWDYNTQVLLASTTVTPASPLGDNFSQFRYAPIPATTITAGQNIVIGALLPASPQDAWLINGSNVLSVNFTGSGLGYYLPGTTLSFPTNFGGGVYAIANASTEVVPETSSVCMVSIAVCFGCAAMYWHRRRHPRSIL